jgi:hypothetical protein
MMRQVSTMPGNVAASWHDVERIAASSATATTPLSRSASSKAGAGERRIVERG